MKTRIKCLIVDDEPLAANVIKSHIDKMNHLEIVTICEDAMEAFGVLQTEPIDLMFLDIQMPELSGIGLLKSLAHKPKVIITTAFRDYAIEGFELEVSDYLLKPISFERFLKSVSRVISSMNSDVHDTKKQVEEAEEFLFVKENKMMVKVFLNRILWIESIKDYVKIICMNKSITTKCTIGSFYDKLPQEKFLRIHRSYIIAMGKIDAYSQTQVIIEDHKIPIGHSYRMLVLEKLQGLESGK